MNKKIILRYKRQKKPLTPNVRDCLCQVGRNLCIQFNGSFFITSHKIVKLQKIQMYDES